MKKIRLFIYYLICSKLPSYWWPGGKLFNKIRILTLRGIIKIGQGTKMQKGIYIGSGNNVEIGSNCQINEKVRLDNVFVGNNAGAFNINGSGNVFLGNEAGRVETGSDKLYIANDEDDKDNALIYGEFNNHYLQINGDLEIKPPVM